MRICLITHHQVANNPRLAREADVLVKAGHEVRVIAINQVSGLAEFDRKLAMEGKWRLASIDLDKKSQPAAWFFAALRQKCSKKIWDVLKKGDYLAGMAYTRAMPEIIKKIASEPTGLIIAHTQLMLAPAYFASLKMGIPWGFDCEDILSEEYGEPYKDLARYAEKTFMNKARYITSASPAFIPWLKEHYGLTNITAVNNIPSLKEAPAALKPGYPQHRDYLSLYWTSMTIGPQRGLEDVLAALPDVKVPVQLHLRGELLSGYKPVLMEFMDKLGVKNKVFLHERVAPQEVVRAASEHDIGLALMQPCCECHERAVPNKLFQYMMAGLAVIATGTEGHKSIWKELPDVGYLYAPGNSKELTQKINALASDAQGLAARRAQAFELAKSTLNWEMESSKFLRLVGSIK